MTRTATLERSLVNTTSNASALQNWLFQQQKNSGTKQELRSIPENLHNFFSCCFTVGKMNKSTCSDKSANEEIPTYSRIPSQKDECVSGT